MISIIICARTKDVSDALKRNIASTIGTKFELVVVDNSDNRYSIYSAYRVGVNKARGDICCFMHDDIIFHSLFWGREVELYFQNHPNVGMIGVVGAHFMPIVPSAWWDNELLIGHLLQGSEQNGEYVVEEVNYIKRLGSSSSVAVVDGMWMCFPRKIFEKIEWDSSSFSGFHGYDLDISFQVWSKGYEVHVIEGVMIEHKSLGVVQDAYYDTILQVYKKWHGTFPLVKGIVLTDGEIEARTRLVEVKNELYQRHNELKRIYNSFAYSLYMRVKNLKPLRLLRNHL